LGIAKLFGPRLPIFASERNSGRVLTFFLWRQLAILDLAGSNIDHAFCPLIQVAQAFGRLVHLANSPQSEQTNSVLRGFGPAFLTVIHR
jgi:hypothetical protein